MDYLNQVFCMDYYELMRQLPDKSIDVLISDPPYGTTAIEWDKAIDWSKFWQEAKRITKGYVVLFSAQPFTTDLINSNRTGFRYETIWQKNKSSGFLDANRKPLKLHENIIVFEKGIFNPQFTYDIPIKKNTKANRSLQYGKHKAIPYDNSDGKRYPASIIYFGLEFNSKHPTQKPLDLMQYLIRTYSNTGDVILDPLCGSGSTLIAARNEGRCYIGGDTSEEYLAIAKKRLDEPFIMRLL